MTSYRIEVGYNSAQSREDVGKTLLDVVKLLRRQPQRIVNEVLRLEPEQDREILLEYAESYREPAQDLTIRVDTDADQENLPVVVQLASGGEPGRSVKESLRRAVCRLVMESMHREQMEVSIHVG